MSRVILDGHGLVVSDVLSAEQCERFIAEAEARGLDEAPITTMGGFVRRPEIRNNDRAMWDDPATAEELWAALRPHLPPKLLAPKRQGLVWRTVGLNERLRVYRYRPGQVFRWHQDGAFRRSAEEVSTMTVLFYLNEVERGGSTAFEPWGEFVRPAPGMALLFDHHVLHQGNEVEAGVKYVLRSDLMTRFER